MRGVLLYKKGKWVIVYRASIDGDDVILTTYPLHKEDSEELKKPESYTCITKFEVVEDGDKKFAKIVN